MLSISGLKTQRWGSSKAGIKRRLWNSCCPFMLPQDTTYFVTHEIAEKRQLGSSTGKTYRCPDGWHACQLHLGERDSLDLWKVTGHGLARDGVLHPPGAWTLIAPTLDGRLPCADHTLCSKTCHCPVVLLLDVSSAIRRVAGGPDAS